MRRKTVRNHLDSSRCNSLSQKTPKNRKNKHMKHSPSNLSHEEAKRLLFSSKPDSIHVHACVGVYIELFNMLIFRGEKLFFLYTNSRVNPSLLT